MTAQDRATLKTYFNTGDKPTEAQYANLVDTIFPKTKHVSVFGWSTSVTTGDGQVYFRVDDSLDGLNLTGVAAQLGAAQSTSGTPTVQIARLRFSTPGGSRVAVDMLSPAITIDINEWDSKDATTAAVIDAANDDLQEGDMLRVDVDVAGTGTQGLHVSLQFG